MAYLWKLVFVHLYRWRDKKKLIICSLKCKEDYLFIQVNYFL
jgi:hypothetical protein